MLDHLLRSFGLLWLLGLLGMTAARLLATPEPSELPFRLAAACWILGGIGFTVFAALACRAHPPRAAARPPGVTPSGNERVRS